MSTLRENLAVGFEFLRYCAVGLVNTSVSVSIMAALAFLGVHYVLYTAIAYFIAMCVSYVLNARVTFARGPLRLAQLGRFLALGCSLFLLAEAVQMALIEGLAVKEYLGVGCGIVVYTGLGFILSKRYVYGAVPNTAVRVSP